MGQKVNPIGMRLQVNRTWDSRWYADSKDYGNLLLEDLKMRDFIHEECKQAGVSRVIIERPHKKCLITIHTARPGLVIGKKGGDIETLRKDLAKMTDDEVRVNLVEIRKPEIDATLIADDIARQLERRASFRRTMKRAIQSAMRLGAEGVKIMVSGRLGGAEKSHGPNGTAKAACRCTRCAPTSIMRWPRPRPLTGSSGSRSGSSRARSWNMIRKPAIAAWPRRRTAPHRAGPVVTATPGKE